MNRARAAAVGVLVGLSACTGLVCTLIACFDGLLINFDRPPDAGTVIEVRVETNSPIVVDCDQSNCGPFLHLSEVTTSPVTVTVTSPAGQVSADYEPEYRRLEPNGPGCGSCVGAEIRVELP